MQERILPGYNYTPEQIERICSIIMATRLPPRPADLLEEIICDSDLDYLGRSDFIPVSNTLFEELKAQNKMKDLNEWNKIAGEIHIGASVFHKNCQESEGSEQTASDRKNTEALFPDNYLPTTRIFVTHDSEPSIFAQKTR